VDEVARVLPTISRRDVAALARPAPSHSELASSRDRLPVALKGYETEILNVPRVRSRLQHADGGESGLEDHVEQQGDIHGLIERTLAAWRAASSPAPGWRSCPISSGPEPIAGGI